MLDSSFTIEDYRHHDGDFNLRLPICSDWSKSDRRLLIILETVDSKDLSNKRLLSDRSRTVLVNVIKQARQEARREVETLGDFSFAAVNFNNKRTFTLSPEEQNVANRIFTSRINKAIKQLKPTHILVSGDRAFRYLFPKIENSEWKRGWVHRVKDKDENRIKVVSTLDLEKLYSARKEQSADYEEDAGSEVFGSANLLGYVIRNLTNLFIGKHLYSLRELTPNPVYINNLEKFNKFYKKLKRAPIVAFDTETKNLSVLHNLLYIIQFALDKDTGYVLPLYHPQTPFTPKELKYIRKRLRKWFRSKPEEHFKFLLAMNGAFDLTVIRYQLKIPIIFRSLWDVLAGETCLDENPIKLLEDFGTRAGNLRSILTSYENDFYFTAAFSKEDRATIGTKDPKEQDVLKYCSMDVQCLHAIYEMQLERAKRLTLTDKPYLPYYKRLVSKQMSNAVHVISHMQARGVNLDKLYLSYLKSKDSPLLKILREEKNKLYAMKSVKQVNNDLTNGVSGGLFGRQEWVFDINKPAHREALFFDQLKLAPISFTKKAKKPQTDKKFQAAYTKTVEEVAHFSLVQKISKLHGTYVKGWWKKLKESIDSATDNRLRAAYGWWKVVSGRLNSWDPNFQQIPTRGDLSKYLKRVFAAPKRCGYFKDDYSAHEVRVWAIISGDEVLAKRFILGQRLRQKYRMNPSKQKLRVLARKGDIHIQNVFFFFKKWVAKEDPLRDMIKSIIFGVIYQKSAASLAKDIKKTKDYAQKLIHKLFSRFQKGAAWLEWAKAHTLDHGYVYAPTGRRRNLYGVLTGIEVIVAAMARRGANSPIQGMASDIAISASRLMMLCFYDYLVVFYDITEYQELPGEVMKFVHDAQYSEVPYEHMLAYLHILQWTATYGVTEYYKKEFGIDFLVEPEIEIEIGATEDNLRKWDWSEEDLKEKFKMMLRDQKELGLIDSVNETMREIYKPYNTPKIRSYLETKYPILGIKSNE